MAPDAPLASGLGALLAEGELSPDSLKGCCAAAYAHPAIRWLLGGELHPGGTATTRHTLELAALEPGDRLLDVAAGAGESARLAAAEFGATALGVEYGESTVRDALVASQAAGLAERVGFVRGDAEALPVPDGSIDVVLCECSLCTFPDKARALAEMARVLAPGGRIAISDVMLGDGPLPAPLRGALGTIACVGDARSTDGYRDLITGAGLAVRHVEPLTETVDRFVAGIEDRLRGARLLGGAPLAGMPLGLEDAITAVRQARAAIAAGGLGYAILLAGR